LERASHGHEPTTEEIARAAQLIRQGRLVAFPTETVYGLGANALDASAIARIYEVKQRPWASPLIVHVMDENMARSVSAEWPPLAQTLARRFWPGPLTLVVKKAEIVPNIVTAGLDSLGIRVPAHAVALELIRRAEVPIAAPSANPFQQISPTTAEHVRAGLGESVDMILDAGPTRVGIESTVVSLRRVPPAILRPGMIAQTDLEAASGVRWEREVDLPQVQESPGLHPRHYAPRTPFYVLDPGATKPSGRGRILEMPDDPRAFGSKLYAELHKADAEGWEWIAVKAPPDTPEWAGILDRLTRASVPPENVLTR
jgi:L-threonylcarbamoyladenylate synthase